MSTTTFINVSVIKAKNLAVADSNGFSDPYVVLKLGSQRKKTKIIKKNLNPEWNETITLDSFGGSQLIVQVFDWDLGSSDDFLGQVVLDLPKVSLDGSEKWYTLQPLGKETNVSGEILLSFSQKVILSPALTTKAKRGSKSGPLDEVLLKIDTAQKNASEKLELSGCSLNAVPGPLFDVLPKLVTLDLSFNNFTSFPDLSRLPCLESLDLNGNQIDTIPPSIEKLSKLRELSVNGNKLTEVPDCIGNMTGLEKLYVANNQIKKITFQIGKLVRLEEFSATGNPLQELPISLGCCKSMEVLDVSCCGLKQIPPEFTYMTKLMELNLATNSLTELPECFGRMTRLVVLNLSDNKLSDVPLSMGYCTGLYKFGAGMNIERNPIQDSEMLRKYRIGPDHLVDYLEKRMLQRGAPTLQEYPLPFAGNPKYKEQPKSAPTQSAPSASSPSSQPSSPPEQPQLPRSDSKLDEKLLVLKRWVNTTIQQELRPTMLALQDKVEAATDTRELVTMAQNLKLLKPEVDHCRAQFPLFETPKPREAYAPIDKLKAAIVASVQEIILIMRTAQTHMEQGDGKNVIAMVQLIKTLKEGFTKLSI